MNPRVEQFLNELEEFAPGLSNGGRGRALHRTDGKTLGELLAEQPDAVLAAALRSAKCRNEIVEELLVVRHCTKLIRVLRAFGADEHTAENLVQDLCVNVLQGALDNFDADQEFGRYLRTMVRNLYRSSARRRQPIFTEDMLECVGPDTVDQEVELREMFNRFEEAIQDFPELEQGIMRMTCDGWQPQEIANEMGLPVSRVYPVLANCRRHLTQILAPTLPPPTRGRPRMRCDSDTCIGEPADQAWPQQSS